MSTRGLLTIEKDDKVLYGTYNKYDSYPEKLGEDFINFIVDLIFEENGLLNFYESFDCIEYDDEKFRTLFAIEQFQRIKDGFQYFVNDKNFLNDLFCRYAYGIDIGKVKKLKFYKNSCCILEIPFTEISNILYWMNSNCSKRKEKFTNILIKKMNEAYENHKENEIYVCSFFEEYVEIFDDCGILTFVKEYNKENINLDINKYIEEHEIKNMKICFTEESNMEEYYFNGYFIHEINDCLEFYDVDKKRTLVVKNEFIVCYTK